MEVISYLWILSLWFQSLVVVAESALNLHSPWNNMHIFICHTLLYDRLHLMIGYLSFNIQSFFIALNTVNMEGRRKQQAVRDFWSSKFNAEPTQAARMGLTLAIKDMEAPVTWEWLHCQACWLKCTGLSILRVTHSLQRTAQDRSNQPCRYLLAYGQYRFLDRSCMHVMIVGLDNCVRMQLKDSLWQITDRLRALAWQTVVNMQ